MKKQKRMLLLAVYLLITTISHGQGDESNLGLFKGASAVPISIHTLKGKTLSIPINLIYSSDGVKVEEHPSWVGLGWQVSAGGFITRTIHKFPDEISYENGFFDSQNVWKSENIMTRSDWAAYGLNLTGQTAEERNKYYEHVVKRFDEPDEFSFSFLGYSGNFYIDEKGKVNIQSNQNLKIQVSNGFSSFFICDDKGTRFEFVTNSSRKAGNSKEDYYIPTSWALKSVKSADNVDQFVFEYEMGPYTASICKKDYAYSYDKINFTWDNEVLFERPYYLKSIKNLNSNESINFSISKSEEYSYPSSLYRACKIDTSLVDTTFLNEKTAPYWQGKTFPTDPYQRVVWLKLDRVSVKASNGVVKSFDFKYNNTPTERLILKELNINDGAEVLLGKYSFNYKNINLIPRYLDVVGDHWGYNNGILYGTNADDLESRKSVNEIFLQAGMLESINFPTGGKAVYEYEINDYSKVVNHTNRALVSALTGNASGLRIKSVKFFDANNNALASETRYLYRVNYVDSGDGAISSGVLNSFPKYLPAKIHNNGAVQQAKNKKLCVAAVPLSLNNDGIYVGYSEVTICSKNSNGKETYTTIQFTNHDNGYADLQPNYTLNESELRYKIFTSRFFERGNVINIIRYDENKKIVKTESNTWERLGDPVTSGVKCLNFIQEKDKFSNIWGVNYIISNSGNAFRYLTYPFVLAKKVTSEYLNGSTVPITSTTTFTYSYVDSLNLCLLKRLQSSTSNGSLLTTSFTYPLDILQPLEKYKNYDIYYDYYSKGINEMKIRYMVGVPVEKLSFSTTNGVAKLISAANFFRLLKNLNYDTYTEEVKMFNPSQRISDYTPISVLIKDYYNSYSCSLSSDPRLKIVSKNTYNDRGLRVESEGKDGVKTSTMWGRNDNPILQVYNASASDLDYLVSDQSSIKNYSSAFITDKIKSRKLRMGYQLFDIDLNGDLRSVSDNLGNTTNFQYDNAGEILYSTDKKGNVLSYSSNSTSTGNTSTLKPFKFYVSKSSCEFREEGGSEFIDVVRGSDDWAASVDVPWATIKKTGTGIILSCSTNKDMDRTGKITITSGVEKREISISQRRGTIPASSHLFDAIAQDCSIDLSNYTGWTVLSHDSILLNFRVENGRLLFSLPYFQVMQGGPTLRTAEINIMYHGVNTTIEIKQVSAVDENGGDLKIE